MLNENWISGMVSVGISCLRICHFPQSRKPKGEGYNASYVYPLKVMVFLIFLLATAVAYPVSQVVGVRTSFFPNKFRIVLDHEGRLKGNISRDFSHKNIKIKLIPAVLATKVDFTPNQKSLAESLVATQDGEAVTITLKTKVPVNYKYFAIHQPDSFVVDFFADGGVRLEVTNKLKLKAKIVNNKLLTEASAPKHPSPHLAHAVSGNKPKLSQRNIVVVIDPGHGGKDPGAIGKYGTREKDVVLKVAQYLQKQINSKQGFKAILTRGSDYFIPLRVRLRIAHENKADMFIAIHADAYKYSASYGASVFALSQRGATSEAARWLAEKENESELGQTISDKNAILRSVLIDLAQTATISSSLEAGNSILHQLSRITRLHHRQVEQAAFVVLKSPDIPSLLVETGFISDPQEEKKLRDDYYQKMLAWVLAEGLMRYFVNHPPLTQALTHATAHT